MPARAPRAAGPRGRAAAARRRRWRPRPAADVERLGAEPVAHALGDEPAPPAAATSPQISAAAPPTCGVAHDVPPHALTASDSGSPGVMSTFVGAAMSGLRRPSSVGPSEEYDSASSDVTSNAPTENEPRASPGVGGLDAVMRAPARGPCGSRGSVASSAACRRAGCRRSTSPPRRRRPAACRRGARAARSRPLDWIGSPVVLCSAGCVSAASVKSPMR